MSEELSDLLKDSDKGDPVKVELKPELLVEDVTATDAQPETATPPEPAPKVVKGISGRPVKVMSQPWKSTDNQWERDVFRVNRRTGWRPRFVDKANVSRKREEGWQVAKAADYGVECEEGQLDTSIIRRGMILMEMPEELALQRDDYFRKKTDMQTAQPDTVLKKALGKTQNELGGSVDMKRLDKHR